MSYAVNLGDALTQIAIAPVASVSATGNTTGVDLGPNGASGPNYEGQIAFLMDSNNTAGSTPTLDVKVQHSDASGSGYTDVTGGGFTQLTTGAGQQKVVLNRDNLKRYVRLAYTLGGTSSPAYSVSVQAVVAKKNAA